MWPVSQIHLYLTNHNHNHKCNLNPNHNSTHSSTPRQRYRVDQLPHLTILSGMLESKCRSSHSWCACAWCTCAPLPSEITRNRNNTLVTAAATRKHTRRTLAYSYGGISVYTVGHKKGTTSFLQRVSID